MNVMIGISNFSSSGTYDIFITKLDRDGHFIWSKSIGGQYWEEVNGIALDTLENVYLTGLFKGTMDFDPDTSTYNLTSNPSNREDIFVSKILSNGAFSWAKKIGGIYSDEGKDIQLDLMAWHFIVLFGRKKIH